MCCKKMIEAWSYAASARFSCLAQHQPCLMQVHRGEPWRLGAVLFQGWLARAYRSLGRAHTVQTDVVAT